MRFCIKQESRIGRREVNQDRACWLATEDAVLMVVADGMGGHLHGEVAAQLAVDTLRESFRRLARPRLPRPGEFLATTMRQAHANILRHAAACRIPEHSAPRTTCIACVVQSGVATWAHAGDSRLYLVHGSDQRDRRVMRTRDHTVVQRMLDEGMITNEQAAHHPMRNRVFSCLGGSVDPTVEVSEPVCLSDGDLIALCTDGAWSPLGDRLPTELAQAPLTSTVPHLLDAAECAAGDEADNLTLIAMRWEAPEPDQDTLREPVNSDDSAALQVLLDEDIERAVADIRSRLPHIANGAAT